MISDTLGRASPVHLVSKLLYQQSGCRLVVASVLFTDTLCGLPRYSRCVATTSSEGKKPRRHTAAAACLNPTCPVQVTWHDGRPPSFCSSRCHKSATRAVSRLTAHLAHVETALAEESTVRGRLRKESERAALSWQLQRYAGCILTMSEVRQLAVDRDWRRGPRDQTEGGIFPSA